MNPCKWQLDFNSYSFPARIEMDRNGHDYFPQPKTCIAPSKAIHSKKNIGLTVEIFLLTNKNTFFYVKITWLDKKVNKNTCDEKWYYSLKVILTRMYKIYARIIQILFV